jgi:hypothetical protein
VNAWAISDDALPALVGTIAVAVAIVFYLIGRFWKGKK